MASTAGNSEEEDDFVNPHFEQQRPDLEYYEHPPLPAVLSGTLVTMQVLFDGLCIRISDGRSEKRARKLGLREMRGWKAHDDPKGFRITLRDETKLIFVGAEGKVLDTLMTKAVRAAIEEVKERLGRGTGSQLNYEWDTSKFETPSDQDPGFTFAVHQDAVGPRNPASRRNIHHTMIVGHRVHV